MKALQILGYVPYDRFFVQENRHAVAFGEKPDEGDELHEENDTDLEYDETKWATGKNLGDLYELLTPELFPKATTWAVFYNTVTLNPDFRFWEGRQTFKEMGEVIKSVKELLAQKK